MTQLITITEVISEAFTRTIPESKFNNSIITTVQYKYLRPMLGDDFFDDVLANVGNYTELLTYVKPVLAWYVKYHSLSDIFTEIGATGVKHIETQNATQVSSQRLIELKEETRTIAESKARELTEYLEDNEDTYTLYYSGYNKELKISTAGGILHRRKNLTDDDDDQWNN